MAEDQEEISRLEDSLVHDEEEPLPEGWGVYATPKFLARMILITYMLMVALVLLVGRIYPAGERIPIFLMPGSLFVALPFAIVALYLEITIPEEAALTKKRTRLGRWITGILTYIVLQVLTSGSWIGIALAFRLG